MEDLKSHHTTDWNWFTKLFFGNMQDTKLQRELEKERQDLETLKEREGVLEKVKTQNTKLQHELEKKQQEFNTLKKREFDLGTKCDNTYKKYNDEYKKMIAAKDSVRNVLSEFEKVFDLAEQQQKTKIGAYNKDLKIKKDIIEEKIKYACNANQDFLSKLDAIEETHKDASMEKCAAYVNSKCNWSHETIKLKMLETRLGSLEKKIAQHMLDLEKGPKEMEASEDVLEKTYKLEYGKYKGKYAEMSKLKNTIEEFADSLKPKQVDRNSAFAQGETQQHIVGRLFPSMKTSLRVAVTGALGPMIASDRYGAPNSMGLVASSDQGSALPETVDELHYLEAADVASMF